MHCYHFVCVVLFGEVWWDIAVMLEYECSFFVGACSMGFLFGQTVFFLAYSTDVGVLSCSSGTGASFYICLKPFLLLGNMLLI